MRCAPSSASTWRNATQQWRNSWWVPRHAVAMPWQQKRRKDWAVRPKWVTLPSSCHHRRQTSSPPPQERMDGRAPLFSAQVFYMKCIARFCVGIFSAKKRGIEAMSWRFACDVHEQCQRTGGSICRIVSLYVCKNAFVLPVNLHSLFIIPQQVFIKCKSLHLSVATLAKHKRKNAGVFHQWFRRHWTLQCCVAFAEGDPSNEPMQPRKCGQLLHILCC